MAFKEMPKGFLNEIWFSKIYWLNIKKTNIIQQELSSCLAPTMLTIHVYPSFVSNICLQNLGINVLLTILVYYARI